MTVFGGAAAALALGLVLGGAMRPNLLGDDRPAGPQTILGQAATRSTGPFDPGPSDPGPTPVSYRGKTPDYVLGTDWTRPRAEPLGEERLPTRAPVGQAVDDADEEPG